jgi:hypothetical protein
VGLIDSSVSINHRAPVSRLICYGNTEKIVRYDTGTAHSADTGPTFFASTHTVLFVGGRKSVTKVRRSTYILQLIKANLKTIIIGITGTVSIAASRLTPVTFEHRQLQASNKLALLTHTIHLWCLKRGGK